MSIHLEESEGVCEDIDLETQSYVFNQTMMRIKDPKLSLNFYTRIIGMRLYRALDFTDMKFTLYFLAMPSLQCLEMLTIVKYQKMKTKEQHGHLAKELC